MKYCPYCGSGLADDMLFCPKCGKKFQGVIENINTPEQKSIETTVDIIEEKVLDDVPNPSTTQVEHTKKKHMAPVFATVLCLLLATVAALYFLFPKQEPANEKPADEESTSEESVDIATVANSVLYLEIYDDSNNITSTASGFVIDDGTTLITNYHVIEDAYHIVAWTPNGERSVDISNILAYDEISDIAVLKCDANIGVTPLTLGDSDLVKQGDSIYAVGYPLGLAHTLSDGVISSRYIDEHETDILQITAAISNGSSGGALLNESGSVIGVICAFYIDGQNLNLAIASNVVCDLIAQNSGATLVELSSHYANQSRIGISANNFLAGGYLTYCGNNIFFEDYGEIYNYNLETGKKTKVADGNNINIHRGQLYYSSRGAIYCCKFDGTSNQKLTLPFQINQGDFIYSILLWEDYLFVEVFDSNAETTLYIVDMDSNVLVDQLSDYTNFTYFGNCIYVGLAGGGMLSLNLDSYEMDVFETSCEAYLTGISNDGTIYYTNNEPYMSMKNGFYYLNVLNGVEHNNQMVRDNIKNGLFGNLTLGTEKIYISLSYLDSDALELCVENNWYLDNHGSLCEFSCDEVISSVSTIPMTNYLYKSDGTTIDENTGEVLGTWFFN